MMNEYKKTNVTLMIKKFKDERKITNERRSSTETRLNKDDERLSDYKMTQKDLKKERRNSDTIKSKDTDIDNRKSISKTPPLIKQKSHTDVSKKDEDQRSLQKTKNANSKLEGTKIKRKADGFRVTQPELAAELYVNSAVFFLEATEDDYSASVFNETAKFLKDIADFCSGNNLNAQAGLFYQCTAGCFMKAFILKKEKVKHFFKEDIITQNNEAIKKFIEDTDDILKLYDIITTTWQKANELLFSTKQIPALDLITITIPILINHLRICKDKLYGNTT